MNGMGFHGLRAWGKGRPLEGFTRWSVVLRPPAGGRGATTRSKRHPFRLAKERCSQKRGGNSQSRGKKRSNWEIVLGQSQLRDEIEKQEID